MATKVKPTCAYCGSEHLSLNHRYNELVVVEKVVVKNQTLWVCQRCLDHRTHIPTNAKTQKIGRRPAGV